MIRQHIRVTTHDTLVPDTTRFRSNPLHRTPPASGRRRGRTPHVDRQSECRSVSSRYLGPAPTAERDERRRGARSYRPDEGRRRLSRPEEHTSELQSLMRRSYAVFCLKNKITLQITIIILISI